MGVWSFVGRQLREKLERRVLDLADLDQAVTKLLQRAFQPSQLVLDAAPLLDDVLERRVRRRHALVIEQKPDAFGQLSVDADVMDVPLQERTGLLCIEGVDDRLPQCG
jgi:hypothetical protein